MHQKMDMGHPCNCFHQTKNSKKKLKKKIIENCCDTQHCINTQQNGDQPLCTKQ